MDWPRPPPMVIGEGDTVGGPELLEEMRVARPEKPGAERQALRDEFWAGCRPPFRYWFFERYGPQGHRTFTHVDLTNEDVATRLRELH